MDLLKDIFPPEVRRWMNLGYAVGWAVLGVWAAVVVAVDGASLPDLYNGLVAGWAAAGTYLGLQSASNITKVSPVEAE